MLSSEQIFGYWNELKGKLREEWGQFSDSEFQNVEGNIEQLIGLIQYKSGQARAQVEAKLTEIASESQAFVNANRQTLDDAAEAAQQCLGELGDYVSEQVGRVEEAVRQRPTKSMAMAFGTGIVAGVILALVTRSK